jgi:hypothetical protein
MPERINGGHVLVVLGAAALIISLLLNWYEPARSAWTVFEAWDLVLAAIGVAALMSVIPRGAAVWIHLWSRSAGFPPSPAR